MPELYLDGHRRPYAIAARKAGLSFCRFLTRFGILADLDGYGECGNRRLYVVRIADVNFRDASRMLQRWRSSIRR